MARVAVSTVVEAPVEAAWRLLGNFNALPAYAPGIATSTLEVPDAGGPAGVMRLLTRDDGSTVRERLLHYDDLDRSLAYEFVGAAPVAVRNYVGRVQLWPVTTTGATFVEWSATFDVDQSEESAFTDWFRQRLTGFLDGARQALQTTP